LTASKAIASGALQAAGLERSAFGHPGDEGLAPFWARLRLVPAEQQAAVFVKEIFAGANARAAFPGVLDTIRAWQPQLVVRDSVEFGVLVAAEVACVPHVRVAVHQRAMEEHICSLAAAPIDNLRQAAGLPADEGAALIYITFGTVMTTVPEAQQRSAHCRYRRRPCVGQARRGNVARGYRACAR
jgi:hypothetical protein